jgi:hypothetical protein
MESIADNQLSLRFTLKHFFKDMGMPQRSGHFHITKCDESDRFHVESLTNDDYDAASNINDIHPMQIDICYLNNMESNKVQMMAQVDASESVPPFIEKMIALIVYKMLKRVQTFISQMVK